MYVTDPQRLPCYSCAAIEAHLAWCREKDKPLTSPKTNLVIDDPARAMLIPVYVVRNFLQQHRDKKTQEWEELEREWHEWQE